MNLRDFLNYRNICPLCSNDLKLLFHSRKRQKINYEDNRLLITFSMDSINKKESCKIGFSLNPDDNSFFIEFYSNRGERRDNIPTQYLKKFITFNKHLGAYKFYKICEVCGDYHYESNYFNIDLITKNYGDLIVNKEIFYLHSPWKDGYRRYQLVNNYVSNKSWLCISTDIESKKYNMQDDTIVLSLINFVSKDEMINRLTKLLIFS